MQITKIKNKQTGEVYDIGADSKLKLVAEGTLEWNEENDAYNKIWDFEEGKFYFIELSEIDGWYIATFQGAMKSGSFITPFSRETMGDLVVCFYYCTEENEYYRILDQTMNDRNISDQMKCKIYELPFSM